MYCEILGGYKRKPIMEYWSDFKKFRSVHIDSERFQNRRSFDNVSKTSVFVAFLCRSM